MTEDEGPGKIYIVPTSHASEDSSDLVEETISSVDPDIVAVELDQNRYKKLINWDISKVNSVSLRKVLSQGSLSRKAKLVLWTFSLVQSRISSKLGVDLLGIDMLSGIESAEEQEIPVVLADQDIHITLNRFSEEVKLRELFRLVGYMILSYVKIGRQDPESIAEEVKVESINLEEVLDALEQLFPTFKRVFIDERDEVIAEAVAEVAEQGHSVVLVIGAGHSVGVKKILDERFSEESKIVEKAMSILYLGGLWSTIFT